MNNLLQIALSNAVAAAILALFALLVGTLSRRPALRHGLWLLVLLKLVTPPLVRIPLALPAVSDSPAKELNLSDEETTPTTFTLVAEPPVAAMVEPPVEDNVPATPLPDVSNADLERASPTPSVSSLWPQILQIVWGIGALGWFLLALDRLHRFRRLLRFSQAAPVALQERTKRLARFLGLVRCPRVRLLPGRIAPMLWAVGGPPRLFVPAALLDQLSEEQLDTLLLHELAHLRRRDHWVRVLEFVVLGLYWWHPAVWYARRELREAEEQCCDAWVVSTLPGTGRTYASALLDTLDFLSTAQTAVPPLASGLGQVADLKRRLTMIMGGTTPRSLSWPGCLAVLAVGACFLPMLPAQSPTPKPEDEPRDVIIKRIVVDDSTQQLDRNKADLDKLQADLQQKLAEIERAKARLKAAEQALIRSRAKLALDQLAEGEKPRSADRGKKTVIRIEIVADDKIDPADLTKQLNKLLPKNAQIRIDSGSNRIEVISGKDGVRWRAVAPVQVAPRVTMAVPSVKEQDRGARGTANTPQDRRINDLERKLEKVLQELQDLRKQMKQPRPSPRGAAIPLNPPLPDDGIAPVAPLPPSPSSAPVAPPPPAESTSPRP